MRYLASSSFAMKVLSFTRSAMIFLLAAAPVVTCGGTTTIAQGTGTGTDCVSVCEQANQCLGRVADCSARCGIRASLDVTAGCSDADSPELAGIDTGFMGASSVAGACSEICPSCAVQEIAWMACAKAYCDSMPWTQVCQLSGIH